jgi:predicted O-methyltransferase YrrM
MSEEVTQDAPQEPGIKTLDEIFKIIDAIPEKMCGGLQPRFLYDLSHATLGKGEIVEIGTCAGKSTIALAYGQQAKPCDSDGDQAKQADRGDQGNTETGRPVHTIDIAQHRDLEANLQRAGVTDFVNRQVRASSKVAESWKQDIELLFVDADHRYNGIVSDLRHWCKFVIVGGKVALHDYPGFEGIDDTAKAVRRVLLSRPDIWRIVADRQAGSIIVLERLKTDHDALADEPGFGNWIKWKINNLKWYFDELRLRLRP